MVETFNFLSALGPLAVAAYVLRLGVGRDYKKLNLDAGVYMEEASLLARVVDGVSAVSDPIPFAQAMQVIINTYEDDPGDVH